MVKRISEDILYLSISLIINLILFTFLAGVFIIRVQDRPQVEPIKVVLKEELGKKLRPVVKQPKPVVKKKKVVRRKPVPEGKTGSAKKVKRKRESPPLAVSKASEKGEVAMPVREIEEDVSILESLEEKIKKRVAKESVREAPAKKEIGNISAVVGQEGVSFKAGSRKIISIPQPPELITREFPSVLRIKIWVSPEGKVIKSLIVQRSGNVKIDTTLMRYVRSIRFEPIKTEEIQVGVISFTFRGG